MKPENAKQLAVSCDLTGVAAMEMQKLIQEELSPDYSKTVYWELQVPSQLLDEGLVISYLLGLKLSLNSSYTIDEWSLSGESYSEMQVKRATYWSPGA